MTVKLANSPCSWGVSYPDAPGNPDPKNLEKLQRQVMNLVNLVHMDFYKQILKKF